MADEGSNVVDYADAQAREKPVQFLPTLYEMASPGRRRDSRSKTACTIGTASGPQNRVTVFEPQAFSRRVNPRNPKWKDYRPLWLIEAERRVRLSPDEFRFVRETLLIMDVSQCAAFLRVSPRAIARWEAGKGAIPFAEYRLLKMVYDTQVFRNGHPEWDGWCIVEAGPDAGKLRDPRTSICYTAHEISLIQFQWQANAALVHENGRLRSEIAALQTENTQLRKLILADGLAEELREMERRVHDLVSSIVTARTPPGYPEEGTKPKLERGAPSPSDDQLCMCPGRDKLLHHLPENPLAKVAAP